VILDTTPNGRVGPGARAARSNGRPASSFLNSCRPRPPLELAEALDAAFGAEPVTVRTIHGKGPGWRVGAGREVAAAVLRQTEFGAQCYNVDVRRDQRHLAEHGLLPCTGSGADRFSTGLGQDLVVMDLALDGDPVRSRRVTGATVTSDGRARCLAGYEPTVLGDLRPGRGRRSRRHPLPERGCLDRAARRKAGGYGIPATFSRTGRYVTLDSRSYFSYGRMYHKPRAMIPAGRLLIDTEQSFTYREGGLAGVIVAARVTGLAPNRTARFTPGTLVSALEVYAALAQGIAVPWQKIDTERTRVVAALRTADRAA
jgi:DNA polymerase I